MKAVRRNVEKMIEIVLDDEQRLEERLAVLVERASELVAEREGLLSIGSEVSLFFADKDEMQRLNEEYRGLDHSTDVLSFPMLDSGQRGRPHVLQEPSPCPVMLGDIVICREIAESQAKEYGHSIEREIAFLFTHGLLHLLGYDHEEDAAAEAMRAVEDEILGKLELMR